jgi:biopolymer transport protein ExbB
MTTMHADIAPFPALPPDLGPWQMFLHADLVVQAVMVGLAIASIATWTVLVAKSWELARIGRALQAARAALLQSQSLRDAEALPQLAVHAARALLHEAGTEQSAGLQDKAGIKERLASRLERVELGYARQLRKGTGLLATIGATAPFVGLFGTVWGIMNSFVGIARANTTNLAVVAPGIAEALLATALGLVAAIPAVVIYNHFARTLGILRQQLGDLSAGLQQLVSRDLDRHQTCEPGLSMAGTQ